VSIVPGASTLAEKGFSPNPVNIKSGDNVTWVNDDTLSHTDLFMVEKLESCLIQDYLDLLP
jgi:plastocyanin